MSAETTAEDHEVTENPWLKLALEVGPLLIFFAAYRYGADLAAWAGYPNLGLNDAEAALVASGGDGAEAAPMSSSRA